MTKNIAHMKKRYLLHKYDDVVDLNAGHCAEGTEKEMTEKAKLAKLH